MRVEVTAVIPEGQGYWKPGDRLTVRNDRGAQWCAEGRAREIEDGPVQYRRRATDREHTPDTKGK